MLTHLLNVNVSSFQVCKKIEGVMLSYESPGLDVHQCKIFAQEMVQNVAISGVALGI